MAQHANYRAEVYTSPYGDDFPGGCAATDNVPKGQTRFAAAPWDFSDSATELARR